MQIFGRAGRPQFDKYGEATLITNSDSTLQRYLNLVSLSVPIESNFMKQLPDHLNAEIVSGTVSNVNEAMEWLKYTYLYIRMKKNHIAYGISFSQIENDGGNLDNTVREMIINAGKLLDSHHMIRMDIDSGNMSVSGLGRVASHFYIQAASVEIFNELLEEQEQNNNDPDIDYSSNNNWSDSRLCHIICSAKEFENVRIRQDESKEMEDIQRNNKCCLFPIDDCTTIDEHAGKCSVLLQAYISNNNAPPLKSFTLISDTNYIASNAGK